MREQKVSIGTGVGSSSHPLYGEWRGKKPPAIGSAPELNRNRLWQSGLGRKTVNRVVTQRFVAGVIHFVAGGGARRVDFGGVRETQGNEGGTEIFWGTTSMRQA